MNAKDFNYLLNYLKHSSSVHAHLVTDKTNSCVLIMNNKGLYEFFNGTLWRAMHPNEARLLVLECPASNEKTVFIQATQTE